MALFQNSSDTTGALWELANIVAHSWSSRATIEPFQVFIGSKNGPDNLAGAISDEAPSVLYVGVLTMVKHGSGDTVELFSIGASSGPFSYCVFSLDAAVTVLPVAVFAALTLNGNADAHFVGYRLKIA